MATTLTDPVDTTVAPHITINSVSVWFPSQGKEIQALDDVTLDIARNEFICVVGRSGCGKTTLLNTLAGFVRPTYGTISVSGRTVTGPGPDRAVVFQRDAVFPWMTVEQNVAFSLEARGKPKSQVQSIVTHYLDLVRLSDFRTAWPRQLSEGMKKRVDLARGYAADPEVILLDEPFGGLDVLTKEALQQELLQLSLLSPRTSLFVTHDIEEAVFLADRVVLMSPRPGTVVAVWDSPFPKPRDASLKLESSFVALRGEITAALQKERNQ